MPGVNTSRARIPVMQQSILTWLAKSLCFRSTLIAVGMRVSLLGVSVSCKQSTKVGSVAMTFLSRKNIYLLGSSNILVRSSSVYRVLSCPTRSLVHTEYWVLSCCCVTVVNPELCRLTFSKEQQIVSWIVAVASSSDGNEVNWPQKHIAASSRSFLSLSPYNFHLGRVELKLSRFGRYCSLVQIASVVTRHNFPLIISLAVGRSFPLNNTLNKVTTHQSIDYWASHCSLASASSRLQSITGDSCIETKNPTTAV